MGSWDPGFYKILKVQKVQSAHGLNTDNKYNCRRVAESLEPRNQVPNFFTSMNFNNFNNK